MAEIDARLTIDNMGRGGGGSPSVKSIMHE